MVDSQGNSSAVTVLGAAAEDIALAERLGLDWVASPLEDPSQQYLLWREGRLCLGLNPALREHPVAVDFGELLRKRHRGKELLIKALGGSRHRPYVLDATAGLGRDSAVMASQGCRVLMCEQMPIVAALLADGLQRARIAMETADIAAAMDVHAGDAVAYLQNLSAEAYPDVIYLDPMFPESGKSALVKKEMRLFHQLVGADDSGPELLALALQRARYRVVVKRPPRAPFLGERAPQLSISGKAVRFDIYPLKAFPKSASGQAS